LKENAMLVQELMTQELVTVHPGTSITEAARTLLDKGITAAPVVDDTGALVGIVSRRDLLVGREIEDPRAHLAAVQPGTAEPPHLVREVMSGDVVTLAPTEDDAHAARLMIDQGYASLPVTHNDQLVGMLSATDILRSHTHSDAEIAQALRQRFAEYGESHSLGRVRVDDGVATISDAANPMTARIAEAVAETTEGVVGVRSAPRQGTSPR
jgi:CBS domain-containing protein